MDCPSEERLIRTAPDGADGPPHVCLAARTVTLHHDGPLAPLQAELAVRGFGAELLGTEATGARPEPATERCEAGVLRTLLAIHAAMFVFELASGLWAQSTGLIADALDMLADASVYGLSLYAVGRSAARGSASTQASSSAPACSAIGVQSTTRSARAKHSASCLPMRWTGLSAVIGSWKITPISFPRTFRISSGFSFVRSRPLKATSPWRIFPDGWGSSRTSDIAVTLFPQPDSPTMPRVLPRAMSKDT